MFKSYRFICSFCKRLRQEQEQQKLRKIKTLKFFFYHAGMTTKIKLPQKNTHTNGKVFFNF